VQAKIASARTHQQVAVERAALDLIGIPFLLHGRSVESGLDCVGLVGLCLSVVGKDATVPSDYRLRGQYADRACAYFDERGFRRVTDASVVAGDVLLLAPGARQIHLAILTHAGAVHAHMGLSRVVVTPLPLPWRIIAHWRLFGD
jgi:lipoprotein Spr